MAAMRRVGGRPVPPRHADIYETEREYVVELDVADFGVDELVVELRGPIVAVRGAQRRAAEDDGRPFRLQERLEETFRLADDVDCGALHVSFAHGRLKIHAPKKALTARAVPIETPTAVFGNPDATPC